ncbi:hypothetical protein BESB_059700 [Besnoitia besnoiti]|uniref:SSXT (Amine-terminal region) protein n=1 Tax=Besnoitia besnoiti TaxID=94643 RepID=A0A2A9MHF0_BESBE|nr:hypothetical protein BESB_059700 [Besnoitia besnoiti]PFH35083.1 hypothetical protein BESB_059700 [Besnoitia besnoiti]
MATLEDIDAFFDALVDGGGDQTVSAAAGSAVAPPATFSQAAAGRTPSEHQSLDPDSAAPEGAALQVPSFSLAGAGSDASQCVSGAQTAKGTTAASSGDAGVHTAGSAVAAPRLPAAADSTSGFFPASLPSAAGGGPGAAGVQGGSDEGVGESQNGSVSSPPVSLSGASSLLYQGLGHLSPGASPPGPPSKAGVREETAEARSPTSGHGACAGATPPAPSLRPLSGAEGPGAEVSQPTVAGAPVLPPNVAVSSPLPSSSLPVSVPSSSRSPHAPRSQAELSTASTQGAVSSSSRPASRPLVLEPALSAAASASSSPPAQAPSALPPPFPLHNRAFPGISRAPQFVGRPAETGKAAGLATPVEGVALPSLSSPAPAAVPLGSAPPEYTVEPPFRYEPTNAPNSATLQEDMAFCAETVSRLIEAKLLENDQMLFAVHENLSGGRYDEAVCFFERLQQNLFFLAMLAEQQPPETPAGAAKNAEAVQQAEQLFRSNGDFWSHEELQRLHHALRTPNLDLRQLSAAVCTKTPQQILFYLTKTVDRHVKPPTPPSPKATKTESEGAPQVAPSVAVLQASALGASRALKPDARGPPPHPPPALPSTPSDALASAYAAPVLPSLPPATATSALLAANPAMPAAHRAQAASLPHAGVAPIAFSAEFAAEQQRRASPFGAPTDSAQLAAFAPPPQAVSMHGPLSVHTPEGGVQLAPHQALLQPTADAAQLRQTAVSQFAQASVPGVLPPSASPPFFPSAALQLQQGGVSRFPAPVQAHQSASHALQATGLSPAPSTAAPHASPGIAASATSLPPASVADYGSAPRVAPLVGTPGVALPTNATQLQTNFSFPHAAFAGGLAQGPFQHRPA